MPPIFARWDRGGWARPGKGIGLLDAPVAWLRRLGMRYPRWVLIITVLLLGVGAPQVLTVEVESDLFRFFHEDHPITQSNQVLTERLSGVTALEVVFEAPARDAFKQVEALREIQAFREWVAARPEVDRVTSLVDMIEEMHWGFHAEDPDYRRLPEQSDLIAQYLFIYDGSDLYELVDRDFRITRVMLNLNVNGASKINAIMADIEAYLEQRALGELSFDIGGFGRLFGDQERLLIEGQIRGLLLAVGLIFLFMVIIWRSLSAALLCMVPNLSPILVIFIVMGLFGIWLDMATAMITGVAVGIAVDDTIHVYYGYSSRRARGRSPVWALARTYQHAGRAVTATTLILSAQFLLLLGSPFLPTNDFGLLTALGLVTALLFDLLVLPALLMVTAGWWWTRRQRKAASSVYWMLINRPALKAGNSRGGTDERVADFEADALGWGCPAAGAAANDAGRRGRGAEHRARAGVDRGWHPDQGSSSSAHEQLSACRSGAGLALGATLVGAAGGAPGWLSANRCREV